MEKTRKIRRINKKVRSTKMCPNISKNSFICIALFKNKKELNMLFKQFFRRRRINIKAVSKPAF